MDKAFISGRRNAAEESHRVSQQGTRCLSLDSPLAAGSSAKGSAKMQPVQKSFKFVSTFCRAGCITLIMVLDNPISAQCLSRRLTTPEGVIPISPPTAEAMTADEWSIADSQRLRDGGGWAISHVGGQVTLVRIGKRNAVYEAVGRGTYLLSLHTSQGCDPIQILESGLG